jgi:uncharacterized protein
MSLADLALDCTATSLYLYPVKACAGLPVPEIVLDADGRATGDRGWAVVDAEGAVTWQGAHPRLALVQPRLAAAGLSLHAAGMADGVATPGTLAPCRVKIWNDAGARHDVFDAADAGDAVAAWLARVVGAPLRLVRLGDAARTREGLNALHLVFSPSIAAVDAQLASAGRPPADPRRYRPNVVLSTAGADGVEFIEDSVETLDWHAGDATHRLEITAPCVRCVVPDVDPESAAVDAVVGDTLTRLSQQRRPGGTVFGIYARGAVGARLRMGNVARMSLAF